MVLVLIEHDAGAIKEESLEAVTMARDIASQSSADLHAVTIGSEGTQASGTVGEYGVDSLHVVTNDELLPYVPEGWAAAVGELAESTASEAVVASGIERSQEVLGRLGAQLDIPMAANCNEVTVGDEFELIRQRWGGSLLEEATLAGDLKLLTVTPHETGATPATEATTPSVEEVSVDLSDVDLQTKIVRVEESDIEGVPLGEARVVVGGGRGVGSADDFDQLEALADALGGTVGSSRAAVNEGWRPHDDQIGLTGAKISPDIYIPCGISGAVQHWVGCKGAKNVLSINIDDEAAIIDKSDWAVTGDLHEVVPAIIEELEARGHI